MNKATALSSTAIPAVDRTVTKTDNSKPTTLSDAQKDAIDKVMQGLANKLSDLVDDEVNELIVSIERSKKDVMTGPFRIYKWAMTHVPKEKLELFPTPGTDYTTSEQPDKYDEVYWKDGKKRYRATSFYLKFYQQNFPEGKRIATALAHVAVAKDDKAIQASVPDDIRTLNPLELESLKEDLVYQQNTGVAAFRDAMKLMKQFDAVNALPEVTAEPLLDKEGNVQRVNKPIHVYNTNNKLVEYGLYSISGFMQFDPAKAAELGGTLDALKLTAKRDQSEDGAESDGTGDKPVIVNTNATLVARLTDIHEFIQNKLMGDPKRELQAQFLKDHIYGAGSDDLIETLDDIRSWATHILNIPAVASRLEAIAQRPAA